jgi:hypothetical protein
MKIETREDLEQAKAAIAQDLHAATQIEWAESCEALFNKLEAAEADAKIKGEYISGPCCEALHYYQQYIAHCKARGKAIMTPQKIDEIAKNYGYIFVWATSGNTRCYRKVDPSCRTIPVNTDDAIDVRRRKGDEGLREWLEGKFA